jgi:hypothetical protein
MPKTNRGGQRARSGRGVAKYELPLGCQWFAHVIRYEMAQKAISDELVSEQFVERPVYVVLIFAGGQ